ncbi:hypothetical protein HDV06_005864 [Boothiomyces sp. JEL0866]|nr:hypothetical protein HDV06_005864 [Boothiomyces sp. JEL0866]
MSQTTLIGNEDAEQLINQVKSAQQFDYAQGYKPIVEHYSDAESEHHQEEQQQEEEEYLLPAYIHLITLGDTIKSIAKHYSTSTEILQRANCITEITEDIFYKRKFIVIPSKSTFNEFIFESEQERFELCRNFCLLFNDLTIEEAEFYLSKSGFNLAMAVENYQFEIC